MQEFASLVSNYGGQIILGCHLTLTSSLLEKARMFATSEDAKPCTLQLAIIFRLTNVCLNGGNGNGTPTSASSGERDFEIQIETEVWQSCVLIWLNIATLL